jgi:cell surface protein SprA
LQSRQYQDVGLDGLGDKDELSFFNDYLDSIRITYSENSEVYRKALSDPSNDNFHYFRGTDFDQAEVGILDRYRDYNGLEGNSPTSEMSKEDYPTTGSTLPNVEDINRDNTLSEKEKYYEYHVSLRPRDMVVGKNYITDMVSKVSDFPNGEKSSVTWYQFRIPVHDWNKSYGGIQDFKSIRFMRMYLNGFEETVILRFAKLDLVRGEWRRYNFPLTQGGEGVTSPEPKDGILDVSAVNIEENAGKTPVNYVLPPGITRVIDPTNPQLRQLNEQSLLMKVQDLEDGDARAVYKNIYMDIRQYRKVQMEVHAEALEDVPLNDNDLVAFIRLGTDYKNNYYEYEVPLKLTLPGRYDNDNPSDQRAVWPSENRFEISLEIFQDIKQARNDAMRVVGSTIDMNTVFTDFDNKGNRISIKGNPNLSNVKTIMLGIRNPKASGNQQEDDGLPKSGEIWLNELRLTDFNEDGGWAANARITTKLADLGTITVSGNTSTPGFGSIEKKVNERSKEEVYQYDITSNFELGKIFPEKAQVSIPIYVGFSETRVNPQYNPLDPDIPLKSALRNAETAEERQEIKYNAQEYMRRKSMNFTNVRKNKLEGPPRFYDIANWALSYSYNESSARDIKTEYDFRKNYRGAISYNFNARPKNVTPFAKVNIFKSPWLRLFKDLNFYYSPSRLTFRSDLNRTYDERLLRNLSNPRAVIDTIVNKNFLWNRYFDLKYDLTRALKLDFSSTNITRIDEPMGVIRKGQNDYEEKKDSILQEIYNGGRTTHYEHSLNISYTVPINKIPLLDWVTLSARYGANYYWDVGPVTADTIDLGNVIKNSSNTQLNGQLNLINLYNKVPYLKKVNQRFSSEGRQPSTEKRTREVNYKRDGIFLRAGEPRSISHNLKTENVTAKFYDTDGQEIQGTIEVLSENRISFTTDKDYRGVRCEVKGTIELGENPLILIADYTSKILMAVRNISISYTSGDGSLLPGYKPSASFAGMERFGGFNAPGLPFVLGFQDPRFPYRAIENGWLSKDSLLNSPYIMNHTTTFNFRGTIEPLPSIRIDLTANRSFTKNLNEYFIADVNGNYPDSTRSRQVTGNFTMSYITLGTAFEKVYSKKNLASATFERFKNEYRFIISERLAAERANGGDYIPVKDSAGYYYGYSGNSQDVLIPAFLAAYGNRDPHKIGLSAFPEITRILPNWRIQYDGLSKIPFLQKLFRSVSITHSYRSSYSVGSFISNPFYQVNERGFVDLESIDLNGNFFPENEIISVSINEQFSPLINIDMNWQNNLTSRFEIKRSRSLSLSLANNQLNEVSSSEMVIGGGYRFTEVPLVFNLPGGGQKSMTSDLNLMADLSIRDNRTMIRKIVENFDQATAGQRVFKINITLDYALSNQFNLRLFFDRVMNDPIVSLAYRTANTNVGFSVRFTLAQ